MEILYTFFTDKIESSFDRIFYNNIKYRKWNQVAKEKYRKYKNKKHSNKYSDKYTALLYGSYISFFIRK